MLEMIVYGVLGLVAFALVWTDYGKKKEKGISAWIANDFKPKVEVLAE